MNETTHRVFEKSVRLIESRAKVKVTNAVLLLETNFGPFTLELNPDIKTPNNLVLANRYIAERTTDLFVRRYATGQMVTCRQCSGVGELFAGEALITCSRCNGGGVMVVTVNKDEYELREKESTDSATR